MQHVGKRTKLRRLNLRATIVGSEGLAHLKTLQQSLVRRKSFFARLVASSCRSAGASPTEALLNLNDTQGRRDHCPMFPGCRDADRFSPSMSFKKPFANGWRETKPAEQPTVTLRQTTHRFCRRPKQEENPMSSKTLQHVVIVLVFGLLVFQRNSAGVEAAEPSFEKLHLLPSYWSEGANVADLNKDGHIDIICGPHWFKGPNFKERFEYYPAVAPTKRNRNDFAVYSLDNFFSFVHDCNRDGWPDILIVGLPGTTAYWYENPGEHSKRAREMPPH
jgi:hypothetical protein